MIIQPFLHLHELSLLLPSFSFYVHVLACFLCFSVRFSSVLWLFASVFYFLPIHLWFFFFSKLNCSVQICSYAFCSVLLPFQSICSVQFDNTRNFHKSLGFGTNLGEFLIIEPWSNSIIKCLSHIQLKMISKNVKNHSYCAIGIISMWIIVMSEIWSHRNKIVFKNVICDGGGNFWLSTYERVGMDH